MNEYASLTYVEGLCHILCEDDSDDGGDRKLSLRTPLSATLSWVPEEGE